ncbi:hypothetical protein [Cedratvirus kamchatka]|uniref:Uncharacterized protein n=1 Tax=Cedratvirus kamchatka TaxID=2716914 RepID=A0A6G8MYB1_9VIRU|nr:hypothetical protein [Cedratvirus kamchatka]
MQAQAFLEEKLKQASDGEEVVLLDMYLEEADDICFVPELDQEKVFTIFEKSKRSSVDMIKNIPEGHGKELVRIAFLPLLILTVEMGDSSTFRYTLNEDDYEVEISRNSTLQILEHAFQLEGYEE